VWSWRPDAGAKFLRSKLLRSDGGKRARSPGRARYKLLKPLRGECRAFSGVTVVTNARAYYHYTRGCGRIGARHSLRPLIGRAGNSGSNLAQNMRRDREIASATPTVIVREGGRSSIPETSVIEPRSRCVLDAPHARGMTNFCGAAASPYPPPSSPATRSGLRPAG
jgi:hypothetical protein